MPAYPIEWDAKGNPTKIKLYETPEPYKYAEVPQYQYQTHPPSIDERRRLEQEKREKEKKQKASSSKHKSKK
jgi:hypothetical protein